MNTIFKTLFIGIILTCSLSCVKKVEDAYISDKDYQVVKLNTKETLNGFHFIDDNIGFVVGDSGLVFKTTNGGISWSKKTLGNFILRDVHFCNSTDGYMIGTNDYITTDKNLHVTINNIVSYIFSTTDGGETWKTSILENAGITSNVYCVNKERVVISSGYYIYFTKDGKNWERRGFEPFRNEDGTTTDFYGLTNIFMTNDSTIQIFGRNRSIVTTNFFASTKVFLHKSNSTSSIMDDKVLLSSYNTTVYFSNTDTVWNQLIKVNNIEGEQFSEIVDVEGLSKSYFFIIAGNHIHRTRDGGANWETIIPRDGIYSKLQKAGRHIYGLGTGTSYYKGIDQYIIKIKI